jgi:hypothetical protein
MAFGSENEEIRRLNEGPINERNFTMSPDPNPPMRQLSVREILQQQRDGAVQEVRDLEVVIAMLPAEMAYQQEEAFRRLFLQIFPFTRR